MEHAKEHHVHFDDKKDLIGKNNQIIVQEKNYSFDVHLGFLQYKHKYKISVSISKSNWKLTDDSKVSVTQIQNNNLQVVSSKITDNEIYFEMELLALKEKLLKEEFEFQLSDKEQLFTVILHARVLGKGKGTPLLKNGIHLIHEPIDDSDDSSS